MTSILVLVNLHIIREIDSFKVLIRIDQYLI